ncbi:protein XRP2 [Parasteatoda tepidariorum]|uniref:protein XRP2 n=1 Tax=Parasteatoda tepidariorum TaxID=114398 RepID=UPI00077FABB0|nr:protein XRP2 [Parasteatoda tepidariorum]XP_042901775.1 protein XRP2 [Parasteatoda tepidariorum]
MMGCLCAKASTLKIKSSDVKKEGKAYSWDEKKTVNPKDFIIENAKDETVVRLPGSVKGQQFIIQNCDNSNIYIYDHINTITVDDCNGCNIFIGPTKGSVFLRDCSECRFLIVCQQFRARDCKVVDVFLCCATQPIIESCSDIRFGCFCFNYAHLEEQFKNACLSIFNNNWSNIHDFTPAEGERNWTLLPKDARIEDFFPLPSPEKLGDLQVMTDPQSSLVPQTQGCLQRLSMQYCLVVFFADGHAQNRALSLIKELEQTDCILLRTKELLLEDDAAERIFGSNAYNTVVKRGPVIGLEYNGNDCMMLCLETAKNIATSTGCTGLVYVSTCPKVARKQIENFFSHADVQLSQ